MNTVDNYWSLSDYRLLGLVIKKKTPSAIWNCNSARKRVVRLLDCAKKPYKTSLNRYSWKKCEGRNQQFPLYFWEMGAVMLYSRTPHMPTNTHTHTHILTYRRSDNNLAQILNLGLRLSHVFPSCPEHNIKLKAVSSLVINVLEWSGFPVVLQYICVSHGCAFYVLECFSSNQNSVYAAESHGQYLGVLILSSKSPFQSQRKITMDAPSTYTSSVCTGLLPATSGNHPNSSERGLYTKSHYKMCLISAPVLLWTQKETMGRPKMRDSR